jgi:alpha-glucosidase
MKNVLLISVLFFAFFSNVNAKKTYDLSSPDGKLHCILNADKNLLLSLNLDGKSVIEPSVLSMIVDGKPITENIRPGKATRTVINETFPLKGLHSTGRNHCNVLCIDITDRASALKYSLEIRLFNDAAAYRFIIPGNETVERYPDEATVFRLPSKSIVWYHDLYMHYEGVHAKKLIDTVPAGQWAAPPLTYKLADGSGYTAITEADLAGYAGMALVSDGKNGFELKLGHSHPVSYPYKLRYSSEDVARLSRIASVKGTITTPWRVIISGKDLNTLVNSDAVYSLCPAPDKKYFPEGAETEWIKPGRAVWKYLDGGGDGTLTVMKKFSKEAADLGFEYNILEGFWSRWPDDSIKALVDYSSALGVKIIVWKHSNTLHDPAARQELFRRCRELGIAGLKIDFFDHEAKEVTDLYESILRETAAEHLVCIFHGANKPTGLWRTWPNAMIYEAVKGMEASKLTDRATHETTIPFTRMIAGPADYSVCHFGTRRQNTSWVHQVATAAIYCAPVITYAATPEHILGNPCAEMIRSIPSVWDETIVLPPSEIGELAVYAQRTGRTWFLSVINGLQPKTLSIPLNFLDNGNYGALRLKDDNSALIGVIVVHDNASASQIVTLNLAAGGGYIVKFDPE